MITQTAKAYYNTLIANCQRNIARLKETNGPEWQMDMSVDTLQRFRDERDSIRAIDFIEENAATAREKAQLLANLQTGDGKVYVIRGTMFSYFDEMDPRVEFFVTRAPLHLPGSVHTEIEAIIERQ
jgi:hypothetical protein